jgi:hypothetical protein
MKNYAYLWKIFAISLSLLTNCSSREDIYVYQEGGGSILVWKATNKDTGEVLSEGCIKDNEWVGFATNWQQLHAQRIQVKIALNSTLIYEVMGFDVYKSKEVKRGTSLPTDEAYLCSTQDERGRLPLSQYLYDCASLVTTDSSAEITSQSIGGADAHALRKQYVLKIKKSGEFTVALDKDCKTYGSQSGLELAVQKRPQWSELTIVAP